MKALALAVVLAAATTTSECGAELEKACTVLFRGLEIENGQVTDVLTPICDVPPQTHKINAWIEYKNIGEWSPLGPRSVLALTIPDKTGFPIKVTAPCLEGAYRSGYHVTGRGPALPDNPRGKPFEDQDYGWTMRIYSVGDCKG